MNEKKITAKDKLQKWFDDPTTPSDAWKTWTLREIAIAANVSTSTVSTHLPKLAMDKYPVLTSAGLVNQAREAWRQKYGSRQRTAPLSRDEIADLHQRRKDGGTLAEIAIDTGHSQSTVQRYCKGIKRGKRK